MVQFSVIHIEDFKTHQRVCKLVRNGKCLLDEFKEEIEKDKNLSSEIGELYALVEDIANNQMLPKTRYRKLHLGKKLQYTGYETKSKNLRLYLFHESQTGQILVFGGKKGDQDEDLYRLEKIIKEFTVFRQSEK